MFLPVTMDSAERIVETIQEIKEKIPPDPFEAELILMAEMVAEDNEKNSKGQSPKNKVVEKKNEKRESPAPCGEEGILNSCFKRISNMLTLLGKENQTFILYKEHKNLPFLPRKKKLAAYRVNTNKRCFLKKITIKIHTIYNLLIRLS